MNPMNADTLYIYTVSSCIMKPRWAYVWEYTDRDGQRSRTPLALTERELALWLTADLHDPRPVPIEETRVDRNVIPLRDPSIQRVPCMPAFDAPNDADLRAMWRAHRDPEIRRLILEIVMLRKSLQKFRDWHELTDRCVADKGAFGGPTGPFQTLRHLIRAEMRRAGML
ncbi:conserved protein of unknown function [Burkholderia multivorans]